MISAEFCQIMARYNQWQNKSLYREADKIGAAERNQDRGAFFGSIQATLAHLLWGDTIWMSRFDNWERPMRSIAESPDMFSDWSDLKSRRTQADQKIKAWAGQLTGDDLLGDLRWYSGAIGAEFTKPRGLLITHFFNHQTHHRGQVHAMLTAAGAHPEPTDLPFMPVPG